LELGVVDSLLHRVVRLLDAPEFRKFRGIPQGDRPAVREADLIVLLEHIFCVKNRRPFAHARDQRLIVPILHHGAGE
jgi:hypothetical protein